MEGMEEAANFQMDHREMMMRNLLDFSPSSEPPLAKRESLISFANPKAQEFFVDGTKIPLGALLSSYLMSNHLYALTSEFRRWTFLVGFDAHLQ